VLLGFAVISKVFAYGGRTPQFEAASGVLIALTAPFCSGARSRPATIMPPLETAGRSLSSPA
jgi:hypothetical protein